MEFIRDGIKFEFSVASNDNGTFKIEIEGSECLQAAKLASEILLLLWAQATN